MVSAPRGTRESHARARAPVVVGFALAAAACARSSDANAERPSARAPAARTPQPTRTTTIAHGLDGTRHVIAVSLDGLRADAFAALAAIDPTATRAFDRLRREGVSTLDARSVPEQTVTMPNHTCMLTGRPVSGEAGHGYEENVDNARTLHENRGRYVPSVFDVAHDRGLVTALFASKTKFAVFARSFDDRAGAPDPIAPDDGANKLDRVVIGQPDEATLDAAIEALTRAHAAFTFVHLAGTDAAGHLYGFDVTPGSAYLDAVRAHDRALGKLLAAIDADPALRRHTAVIVTSDHGGLGHTHGDETLRENFAIPFVVWGPGVAAGQDPYATDQTRAAPGALRRRAEAPPIHNCDLGNLALALLGLPPIPGSVFGAERPVWTRPPPIKESSSAGRTSRPD
jgi:hypothetical protein